MGQVTTLRPESPYADEALERQLCGWALTAGRQALANVLARLRPGLCTQPLARAILSAVRRRLLAGDVIDAAAVYADLRDANQPVTAGTLAQWHDEWAELGTLGTLMLDVLEDYERQRTARSIRGLVPEPTGIASLGSIRAHLDAIPVSGGASIVPILDVAVEATASLDAPQSTTWIRTGLSCVDHYVGGFKPGDLVVVGARTSVGKSAFAARLARGVRHVTGRPVLYHTIEMSRRELLCRWIADVAAIENWRVQRGRFADDHERLRAHEAVRAISGWHGLSILDVAGTFAEHLASYEQFVAQNPTAAVIVVDYLGLIRGVEGASARYQEIGIITHTLKAMAKRLGVVIVAVSQLNRQSASGDRAPALYDLRESGDIEQDSDCVLLLHVPERERENDRQELTVIVAKNRSGGLGSFTVDFDKRYCRIEERAESRWGAGEERYEAASVECREPGTEG